MRLVDFDPHWYTMGESPDIVGITFDCPCLTCRSTMNPTRLGVLFREEIDRDGLPNDVHWARSGNKWHREGESFDNLTLTPSIDVSAAGHWHGFVTGGAIT